MSSKVDRIVTQEDIAKYEPMIDFFLKDKVVKNWNEASLAAKDSEVILGNTGWTMDDIRQHLRTEVFVALRNFDPNHITPEGKTVKESSFVYGHLNFRVGSLMKRLVKPTMGYGKWTSNIEEVQHEIETGD